jgi:hypothetical protein
MRAKVWFIYGAISLVLAVLVRCTEYPRCSDANSKGYRVAVAFYGLSRSLHTTLPSFEKRVFGVLDRHRIAYDVFWSGMDTSQITNQRSGEIHQPLNSTEFSLIRPCVFNVVSQSIIVPNELKAYTESRIGLPVKIVDLFRDDLQSIRNLLSAFHAMRTAHSMIVRYSKAQNIAYDAVLVLRPDTAVVNDIDLPQYLPEIVEEERQYAIGNSTQQSIWIPDFQHWRGYNDRAAYGSMRVITPYLMRGLVFRDHIGVATSPAVVNGETFLKLFLEAHNITFRPSTLRVVRVRADGAVAPGDAMQKHMLMDNSTFDHYVQNCLYHKDSNPAGPAYFNAKHC